MDSLTQIAVGIATVEVVAGKSLGNKKTFLYGAILGTFPDLDVWFGYLLDPVTAVDFHRSLTHSFLGIILLSPILGSVLWRIERKYIHWWHAVGIIAATIATHIAIDLFTSWGVQLFYPFSQRVSFKTIFVIDPLYTLPWIIGLSWMWKSRGAKRKKILRTAFYLSSVYLLWSVGAKLYAVQVFKKSLAKESISYTDLIVKPTALNTILWQAQVKTKEGYYIGDYSFFDQSTIQYEYYSTDPTATLKIKDDPAFKKLALVTEGWYTVAEKDGLYYLNDLRFGAMTNQTTGEEQFIFSYVFIPIENSSRYQVLEVPKATRDGKALMQNLWIRLKGR